MPANHDTLLSVLLCCLPCLLLLLLAPHIRLGPIRINGILYHFTPLFQAHQAKPQPQTLHEGEWMLGGADEIPLPPHRTASGLAASTTRGSLLRLSDREIRTKAVKFHDGSSLPQRTVEELRRIVRKCRKSDGEERFWTGEEDMPIIKVLHD